MEYPEKEVFFFKWCYKCEHDKTPENEDPCWDCLNEPMNIESHKPVHFKEATNVRRIEKVIKGTEKRSK